MGLNVDPPNSHVSMESVLVWTLSVIIMGIVQGMKMKIPNTAEQGTHVSMKQPLSAGFMKIV